MDHNKYLELVGRYGAVHMERMEFTAQDYHDDIWKKNNVTVLICQRQTKTETQMCVESLLRFYPDIPILLVDGKSEDDSELYLQWMAAQHPNITFWQRGNAVSSHGLTMDEAIRYHIKTTYVLLMDSDIITHRHGYIEGMLEQFAADNTVYATGSLMLVTRFNHAVGAPLDEDDILRYAHPSCSMYHVATYKQLKPFADHGSPCVYNIMDALDKGLKIGMYPVDKYVTHLSGTSWVKEHKRIWKDGNDVFIRPFLTFIPTLPGHMAELEKQEDRDFDLLLRTGYSQLRVHDGEGKDINNQYFSVRNQVMGEYVCLLNEDVSTVEPYFVRNVKVAAIDTGAADEMNVGGLRVVRRRFWQRNDCLA